MYKRIIAGVLSAVICSSAITSNNVSQTSWGASANKSLSSKAENESTSYDVDSPDKSTNDTSDGDKNSLQSPEIDTKFGEIKMSNAFSLDVKADESTENESEVAESNEKKPLILSISDDAEIYESVDLGENIKADIYNNGLLRIYGHGEMKNFSEVPFVNAAAITQVLFEDTDAENGLVITNIGANLFKGMKQLNSAAYGDISKTTEDLFVLPDSIKTIG